METEEGWDEMKMEEVGNREQWWHMVQYGYLPHELQNHIRYRIWTRYNMYLNGKVNSHNGQPLMDNNSSKVYAGEHMNRLHKSLSS